MKKRLLFTALVLVGMTSAAIAQNMRPLTESSIATNKSEVSDKMQPTILQKKEWKDAVISINSTVKCPNRVPVARADEAVEAYYAAPVGSLYRGVTSTGWFSSTILATPVDCKPTFKNYSTPNAQYKWSINNGSTTKPLENVDSKGNMTCDPIFGFVYTPLLEVTKGTATDSYYVGKTTDKSGNLLPAIWNAGTDVMTLSYGDPGEGKVYGGFTDLDFSAGKEFNNTGKKVTGFCTTFDKPLGHLFARSMYMFVSSTAGAGKLPIGDDVVLTLKLHKLTAEGKIGEEVGKATATTSDMELITGTAWCYMRFTFTGLDEFGFPVPQPLNLGDSPLIALFTGFEKASLDMPFSDAKGFAGNSYVILEDGSLATVGYSNLPNTPQINFCIGFEGAFPHVKVIKGTETAVIPDAGGIGVTQTVDGKAYNDIDLATSISLKDDLDNDNYIITSQPEWITEISVNDETFESHGITVFFVKGSALPAGVTGRSGKIELDVCGVPVSFNVIQGDGVVSISNTKVVGAIEAMYDGANFQLTYPEKITTVSVVNIAGQIVQTYELPVNGQFTLPAANLAKGIYLLRFNSNQTIKVIK